VKLANAGGREEKNSLLWSRKVCEGALMRGMVSLLTAVKRRG